MNLSDTAAVTHGFEEEHPGVIYDKSDSKESAGNQVAIGEQFDPDPCLQQHRQRSPRLPLHVLPADFTLSRVLPPSPTADVTLEYQTTLGGPWTTWNPAMVNGFLEYSVASLGLPAGTKVVAVRGSINNAPTNATQRMYLWGSIDAGYVPVTMGSTGDFRAEYLDTVVAPTGTCVHPVLTDPCYEAITESINVVSPRPEPAYYKAVVGSSIVSTTDTVTFRLTLQNRYTASGLPATGDHRPSSPEPDVRPWFLGVRHVGHGRCRDG